MIVSVTSQVAAFFDKQTTPIMNAALFKIQLFGLRQKCTAVARVARGALTPGICSGGC